MQAPGGSDDVVEVTLFGGSLQGVSVGPAQLAELDGVGFDEVGSRLGQFAGQLLQVSIPAPQRTREMLTPLPAETSVELPSRFTWPRCSGPGRDAVRSMLGLRVTVTITGDSFVASPDGPSDMSDPAMLGCVTL